MGRSTSKILIIVSLVACYLFSLSGSVVVSESGSASLELKTYTSQDYGLSFKHTAKVTVVDRHNINIVIKSSKISKSVKSDLEKFWVRSFQAILVRDITNSNGVYLIINELSERLQYENVESLDEFLMKQEEIIKSQHLLVEKNEISLGPKKIPATQYIRKGELLGKPREAYNTYFQINRRSFSISFMYKPTESQSKETLDSYVLFKTSITVM